MAANLINHEMANRLEEVNLHTITKERRGSWICKLCYNVLNFTH